MRMIEKQIFWEVFSKCFGRVRRKGDLKNTERDDMKRQSIDRDEGWLGGIGLKV